MKRQVLVLLAAGLLIAAQDDKSAAIKKEQPKLEGTWSITSMMQDGKPIPAEMVGNIRLILKDGKYTVKAGEQLLDEGTFEFDPTKSPKTLDTKGTVGEKKGINDPGIYKLDGDTMTTCFGPTGKSRRPTEFSSKAGSGDELTVFKRVTK